MKETITSFVGLDIPKDSIAIAVAEAGRSAPRFVGTTVPTLASLCKALRRRAQAKRTLVVYEPVLAVTAGPVICARTGGDARLLRRRALCAVRPKSTSKPIGVMRCCWPVSRVLGIWSKSSCPTKAMRRSAICRALEKTPAPRA